MKKIRAAFAVAFALAMLATQQNVHAQTLSASLGWGTFVQGMDSVINVFTLEDPPVGTTGVTLFFYKGDISHLITVRFDFKQQNGLVQGVDMGQLEPGTMMKAVCYNASNIPIGATQEFGIAVLPRPSWLFGAHLSNVKASGTAIALYAEYSIPAEVIGAAPDTIAGIGGRHYRLKRPSVGLNLTYHTDTRETNVKMGTLAFDVNLFGQRETRRGIPLPTFGISLDRDFNLSIKVADSIYQHLFSANIPLLVIPLPAFCDISVDAGISVGGMLKGQVVVGNDSSGWGFVRDSEDATGLSTRLVALGFVRGSFNVLGGLLLKVEGTLSILAQLGAGFDYVNVPASQTTSKFGGTISVFGEAGARAFWFFEFWHVGPEEFYRKEFGTMPGRIIDAHEGRLLTARTQLVDLTPPMPRHAPQPAVGTFDGDVGVAWLDSLERGAGLWLAVKDRAADRFDAPVLVASNDHGIGAPSVALLPGGSAFVAWTQNRYTSAGVPDSISLPRLLAAQDVRVAFHDNTTGTTSRPIMMMDDTTTPESGRAEAEPRICVIDEHGTMLIWLAQESPGASQVYSAVLTRTGGAVQSATPRPIPGVSGMNRNPQLVQLPYERVLAVWANDPDGDDTTEEMRVMSAVWSDSAWSAPVEIARAEHGEAIEATALGSGSSRAVVGWISTSHDDNGGMSSTLHARVWSSANNRWEADGDAVIRDSAAALQNVTVSIATTGQAVVAWQRVPLADSVAHGEGARGLLLRDLHDAGGAWRREMGPAYLTDTTAYVWNAATVFGAGSDYSTLTEEQPRDGSMRVPAGGVRFGSNERGLVWRSMSVAPDLTIGDRPEPGTPVSSVTTTRGAALAGLAVWPNPAHADFTVTYSLRAASPVAIEIVDVMGRTVGRVLDERVLEAGTYQTNVSTEGLAGGVYWVVVRSGGEVRRGRVVVGR